MIAGSVNFLSAQETGLTQRETQAENSFDNADFSAATEIFTRLLDIRPESPRVPRWVYFRGRAYYHLDDLNKAKDDFSRLIKRFSQNPLAPYANLFLGNIHFREDNKNKAADSYVLAYAGSSSADLDELSLKSLTILLDNNADLKVSPDIINSIDRETRRDLEIIVGSLNWSQNIDGNGNAPLIYLAVPLSGKLQEYGELIQRGIELAIERLKRDNALNFRLEIRDTEGDPIRSALIAQEASESGATAMIGPLTSEEAVSVSATIYYTELPVIAPVASESGLSQLSEAMFFLTASPEIIGRQLAEYAFLELPVSNAAVIAPNSPVEKHMAESFIKRFEELGGEIVASSIFPKSSTDFGGFCRAIKDRFLWGYDKDAIMIDESGDTLRWKEIPVELGCVFAPATSGHLKLILPQLNFYNIKTTVLGTDGWSSQSVRELNLQNWKDVIFSSASILNETRVEQSMFAQLYRLKYDEKPKRLASLSFDAINIISAGIRTGAKSPQRMLKFMNEMKIYRGASGDISFGERRVNNALPLYTLDGSRPTPIQFSSHANAGELTE